MSRGTVYQARTRDSGREAFEAAHASWAAKSPPDWQCLTTDESSLVASYRMAKAIWCPTTQSARLAAYLQLGFTIRSHLLYFCLRPTGYCCQRFQIRGRSTRYVHIDETYRIDRQRPLYRQALHYLRGSASLYYGSRDSHEQHVHRLHGIR